MKEVIYMYVKGVGWVPERETIKDWSAKEYHSWYEARIAWARTIVYPRTLSYADGI